MSDLILGVDGGGSKTAVVLADRSGEVLGRGSAGASNYQVVGKPAALEALQLAIRAAFAQAGQPVAPVSFICLGLAGVGREEDRAWLVEWCKAQQVAEQVEILVDIELLIWAGTPQGWGVGCISGTGSIAFGVDPSGNRARAGGWGYILGDEGSGYAIGQAALRAVTQAADGRATATALTRRILDTWKLAEPAGLVQQVYRSGMAREQIGALAELVVAEAGAGDAVAAGIISTAARDLSQMLVTVARKLSLKGEIPCALGGGVLAHSVSLAQQMVSNARQFGVILEPIQVVEHPVLGAVRCAVKRLS